MVVTCVGKFLTKRWSYLRIVLFWYNTFSMKSVTISLSEQELEEWKEEAWKARKRLSEWVRWRVREAGELTNVYAREKVKAVKQEDKKPGVQVEINELANFTSPAQKPTHDTAEEVRARMEEVRAKKQKEELTRLKGAQEAFEKRFK